MKREIRLADNVEQQAIAFLKSEFTHAPELAIILGSGLGSLVDSVQDPHVVATSDIPGYPTATVLGHAGQWVSGTVSGRNILFVQGRVHLYEGHAIRQVTYPVRLLHGLGVKRLIVTNAAGGINKQFRPGMVMFITDHINLAFSNPLSGPNVDGGPRFLDMSEPYDLQWTQRAIGIAVDNGIKPETGVYLWTLGPSYETRAEIRFFRLIGADAVGMSTVPEVLQARTFGMKVLGISMISNLATDLQTGTLDHAEVMDMGNQVAGKMVTLLKGIIGDLPIS